MKARPTSILALLVKLAALHKNIVAGAIAVLLGIAWMVALGDRPEHVPSEPHAVSHARFASFNIEFFPKNQRQVQESFALIEEIGASAIGLQEITNPDRFHHEARRRLGTSWDFVFQEVVAIHGKPKLHIGLLYDTDIFQLERVGSRNETRIDDRTQPTLEVRLRDRRSGARITMLIIHFKALPEGREQRIKQFAGLTRIVRDLQWQKRDLIIMGDFNATEEGDRDSLGALAESSELIWATEDLPCSAFWERLDSCPTSRLDHILMWTRPTQVVAKGGCEEGCQERNSCPLYRRDVSDHCPVVVDL